MRMWKHKKNGGDIVSDLIIDEYEVIADFPASMLNVGDVVNVYRHSGMTYAVEIDDHSEKIDVKDFPHLFRLIEV